MTDNDQITADLGNELCRRVTVAFSDLCLLAETKEDAFRVAVSGLASALAFAGGALDALRGVKTDPISAARTILDMMEEATRERDAAHG